MSEAFQAHESSRGPPATLLFKQVQNGRVLAAPHRTGACGVTSYKTWYEKLTPAQSGQLDAFVERDSRGPRSGDDRRLVRLLAKLHVVPRSNRFTRRTTPIGTYAQRFWARVYQSRTCWLWTGPVNQFGYGQFSFAGHTIHAHRVSYAIAYGVPSPGLCICHHCDNRGCVRPDHLFAATQGDNLRDMVRKGRHPETVPRTGRS